MFRRRALALNKLPLRALPSPLADRAAKDGGGHDSARPAGRPLWLGDVRGDVGGEPVAARLGLARQDGAPAASLRPRARARLRLLATLSSPARSLSSQVIAWNLTGDADTLAVPERRLTGHKVRGLARGWVQQRGVSPRALRYLPNKQKKTSPPRPLAALCERRAAVDGRPVGDFGVVGRDVRRPLARLAPAPARCARVARSSSSRRPCLLAPARAAAACLTSRRTRAPASFSARSATC